MDAAVGDARACHPDVVIVGGGLAGLMAAEQISRRATGLRVLVCEQDHIGGSSRLSIGSISAGGTRRQAQAGVDDTTAAHFEALVEMAEVPEAGRHRYAALLRAVCDLGPRLLEHFEDLGVTFAGPYLEPPHLVPRMHNAVPAGSRLVEVLEEALRVRGDVVIAADRAVRAIDSADGGLTVTFSEGDVRASTVVIACGDQSATHASVPGLNPAARGTPIDVAEATLGARRFEPRFIPGPRTVAPGKPHVAPMPHVLDAATVLSVDRQLSWHDYAEAVRAGKDLGEVALLVHPETLPPGPVCTYPGIGYAALDDLLRDGLATRRDGGAVVIGPLRLVVTIADGGLDVDTSLRVLDRAGQPIDGLYACGSAALGDVKLEGHGHHLLWAAGTGWLAGGSIADRMKH